MKKILLIIFGGHFLGAHSGDRCHFGPGCDTVFECLLKHSH